MSVSSDATGVVRVVNGIAYQGGYTVVPSSPVATSGGLGTGLTLSPTWQVGAFNQLVIPSDLSSIIDVMTPDQWGTPKGLRHFSHRRLLQVDPLKRGSRTCG